MAVLNETDYEPAQHAPEFLSSGCTHVQLDALADFDATLVNSTPYSPLERVRPGFYARDDYEGAGQRHACFDPLKARLPLPWQMQLAGVIAAYNMDSPSLEALQVQHESG